MARGKPDEKLPLLAEQDERDLLDVTAAARLLGKSRPSIYRYLEEGRLGGRKIGARWYVFRDTVDRWWEAGLVVQSNPEHYSPQSKGNSRNRRSQRGKNAEQTNEAKSKRLD